jgi:predicted membrane protein
MGEKQIGIDVAKTISVVATLAALFLFYNSLFVDPYSFISKTGAIVAIALLVSVVILIRVVIEKTADPNAEDGFTTLAKTSAVLFATFGGAGMSIGLASQSDAIITPASIVIASTVVIIIGILTYILTDRSTAVFIAIIAALIALAIVTRDAAIAPTVAGATAIGIPVFVMPIVIVDGIIQAIVDGVRKYIK